MLVCAESDSSQFSPVQSYLFREYLHENETFSKAILACLSGGPGGLDSSEKNAKNSCDTATLCNKTISHYTLGILCSCTLAEVYLPFPLPSPSTE